MGNGRQKTKNITLMSMYKFQESDPLAQLLEQLEYMESNPAEYAFGDKADELEAVEELVVKYYQERVTPEAIENGLIVKMRGNNTNELYITKSPREGVKYQLTYVDEKGPWSHLDLNSLDEIIEELAKDGGIILKR